MSFFSDLEAAVLKFFQGIGFFSALFQSIAANGGQVLLDAAMSAVIAAEQAGGTGAQKMASAIAAVEAKLAAEGLPVVENAIRGAIEAAVAQLKAQQAQAAGNGVAPVTGSTAG